MRPTRFLISATQTVEESKRELCLNEYARFKTLLDGSASPHHFICLSVFLRIYRSLAFFLVVIIMGKQQKWQFKREKHLSTWLNTQMSFRTWLPCVHTCLSGHTLSISYSNLLYMGKYVQPNEGRADLAHVRVWDRAFDSYPCFITSDSDMKPEQHLFSLSFILLLTLSRISVQQSRMNESSVRERNTWYTSYITPYSKLELNSTLYTVKLETDTTVQKFGVNNILSLCNQHGCINLIKMWHL